MRITRTSRYRLLPVRIDDFEKWQSGRSPPPVTWRPPVTALWAWEASIAGVGGGVCGDQTRARGAASAWIRAHAADGGILEQVRMVTMGEDLLPCWRVWRSDADTWFGTRHDLDLSQAATELGYVRTVGADTAEGLRRPPDGQAHTDGQAIAGLGSLR
jgi:hypothetical protein